MLGRWGRFQNPDQAAHYEFLCRQAGVRVVYCAEPFGEDVAPITTIVKHLKRVMAGEYSRELSARLSRAKRQQAQLGFRQGGCLIYGFRRLLLDCKRNPRKVLNNGESKALTSDKVVTIPGPPEELAVITRIFSLYVRDQLSIQEIVKQLAEAGTTAIWRPRAAGGMAGSLRSHKSVAMMQESIFDEAQRAWDAAKMQKMAARQRSFGAVLEVPSRLEPTSEPSQILEEMDRHVEGVVVVALCGSGQEIHDGEAGVGEWTPLEISPIPTAALLQR
jgi:DNA invertase Pin-like site-specific DNA recombinase